MISHRLQLFPPGYQENMEINKGKIKQSGETLLEITHFSGNGKYTCG